MGIRLIKKSIVLAMRSRRRFIVFSLMYTVLMIWMAYNFESYIVKEAPGLEPILMLVISIISTVALSILYAFIIINYRKTEIATLKCIGYTNSNIRTIIIGELVWVTMIAFTIILEILIHISAIFVYFEQTKVQIGDPTETSVTVEAPLLSIFPLIITLAMFLISQIVGILVMYRKVLKLRPIVALRVIK